MKKIILFALGIVVITLMTGCAGTYKLENSQVLNQTNLSLYRTFAITPYAQAAQGVQKGRAVLSEMDYNNLANGIRMQMISRGYTEYPASNLVIALGLFMERDADVTTNLYPAYPYGGFGWRGRGFRGGYAYQGYTTARVYKEGIWVVDMIDTQRQVHVFSAAVSAEMDPRQQTLKDIGEIQKASSVLFKKFPVKPIRR